MAERWSKHKYRAKNGERKGNLLYDAMRKAGVDNCKCEVIKTIHKIDGANNQERLMNAEKSAIKRFNTIAPNGLNKSARDSEIIKKFLNYNKSDKMKIHEILAEKINNRDNIIFKFVDIGEGKGNLDKGILPVEKQAEYLKEMLDATTFLDGISVKTELQNLRADVDGMGMELELVAGRNPKNKKPVKLTDDDVEDIYTWNRKLRCEKLRAITQYERDVLKYALTRQGFEQELVNMFAAANGQALERNLIYGNTEANPNTAESTGYLAIDGIIKKLQDDGDNPIGKVQLVHNQYDETIFSQLWDILDSTPEKYLESAKWFVPREIISFARRYVALNKDNGSIEYIQQKNQFQIEGIPLIAVPAFSTLRNGFTKKPLILTYASGTGCNIQAAIDKKEMEIETDFHLREDMTDIVSRNYADINFQFLDGSTLAFLTVASEGAYLSTVSVSVKDENNDGVSGAAVTLIKGDDEYTSSNTGSAGGATLTDVPYGKYMVDIELPTGYSLDEEIPDITINESEELLSIVVNKR